MGDEGCLAVLSPARREGRGIPLEQSQRFADMLKAAGVLVTLDVVEGGGHGGMEFWTVDGTKRLAEFLNRHLMKL
jgi:acetyl esterase/lipase